MLEPGRQYSVGTGYRYGFNGKEDDDEISGEGNKLDFGARVYDSRVGQFLSTDPLAKSYPFFSPYQFAGNNPILFIDNDGEELRLMNLDAENKQFFITLLQKSFDNKIQVSVNSNGVVTLTGDISTLSEKQKEMFNSINTVIKDPAVTRLVLVKKAERWWTFSGDWRRGTVNKTIKTNYLDLWDAEDVGNKSGVITTGGTIAHEIWETFKDQKAGNQTEENSKARYAEMHDDALKLQSKIDGVTYHSMGGNDAYKKTSTGEVRAWYTDKDGKRKTLVITVVNGDATAYKTTDGWVNFDGKVEPEEKKKEEKKKTTTPAPKKKTTTPAKKTTTPAPAKKKSN